MGLEKEKKVMAAYDHAMGIDTEHPDKTKKILDDGRLIPGVGADTPTTVTKEGGKQSDLPYRSDLLPALALLIISAILKEGAEKYGINNWRTISSQSHLNHVLTHILAYLAGDRSDDHLGHAACRMLFAVEVAQSEGVCSEKAQTTGKA